jgi:hypothetical protein
MTVTMTFTKTCAERWCIYTISVRVLLLPVIFVTSVTTFAVLAENCASTRVITVDSSSAGSAKRTFMPMGVAGKKHQSVLLEKGHSNQVIDAMFVLATKESRVNAVKRFFESTSRTRIRSQNITLVQ